MRVHFKCRIVRFFKEMSGIFKPKILTVGEQVIKVVKNNISCEKVAAILAIANYLYRFICFMSGNFT